MRVFALCGLLVVAAALTVAPASARPQSYTRYHNARFGFSTLRPTSFTTGRHPEDGDGLDWTTDHSQVYVAAFGDQNLFNRTPKQQERADHRGLDVTYQNITGRVVTVSGYNHHRQIIYIHDVVGRGSIDTLYWRYPKAQRTRWNTAVTKTAKSFRAGNLSKGH